MKNRIFGVEDWTGKIVEVFMTKVKAEGWVARYKNNLPKEAHPRYYEKYKVVSLSFLDKGK